MGNERFTKSERIIREVDSSAIWIIYIIYYLLLYYYYNRLVKYTAVILIMDGNGSGFIKMGSGFIKSNPDPLCSGSVQVQVHIFKIQIQIQPVRFSRISIRVRVLFEYL